MLFKGLRFRFSLFAKFPRFAPHLLPPHRSEGVSTRWAIRRPLLVHDGDRRETKALREKRTEQIGARPCTPRRPRNNGRCITRLLIGGTFVEALPQRRASGVRRAL